MLSTGPKDQFEYKALRSKNGVELPKQLAGFQEAAPLAGFRGAAPPKEIYILRSQKWEKLRPESSPEQQNREKQKSRKIRPSGLVNPPERIWPGRKSSVSERAQPESTTFWNFGKRSSGFIKLGTRAMSIRTSFSGLSRVHLMPS